MPEPTAERHLAASPALRVSRSVKSGLPEGTGELLPGLRFRPCAIFRACFVRCRKDDSWQPGLGSLHNFHGYTVGFKRSSCEFNGLLLVFDHELVDEGGASCTRCVVNVVYIWYAPPDAFSFLPRIFLPAVPWSQCRPPSQAPCKPQLLWHAARQERVTGRVGQDVIQKRRVAVHIGSASAG